MEERPKRERKVFLLRAHFLDEADRPKSRSLRKIPCEAFGGELQRFQDAMLGQIDRLANAKGIPVERLYAASMRHGNDGDPVIRALQPVLPTPRGSQPKTIIRGPMPPEARLTLSPRDP